MRVLAEIQQLHAVKIQAQHEKVGRCRLRPVNRLGKQGVCFEGLARMGPVPQAATRIRERVPGLLGLLGSLIH